MFHPSAGGQGASLARRLGAAWGKEGNLKLPKVRDLGELGIPPFQILVAPFPRPPPSGATTEHGSVVFLDP